MLAEEELSQSQENLEHSRSRGRKLKTDLKEEKAKVEKGQKLLDELQDDRRDEANEYGEKLAAATQRIKELKEQGASESEEVEVYPSKIAVAEFTSTSKTKKGTLVLKTQVKVDGELVPLTIRTSFKKLKAALEEV